MLSSVDWKFSKFQNVLILKIGGRSDEGHIESIRKKTEMPEAENFPRLWFYF